MAPGQDTIGEWTSTILVKFIRDLFQNQPPDFLPLLRAEQIEVENNLIIKDKFSPTKEKGFRLIGGQGNPPFLNAWVNFDAGWQQAGFWRDVLGFVHLRGLIKTGTINTAAFTLPPGYRPALSEVFPTMSNAALGRLSVAPDGSVVPEVGSAVNFALSGIYFRTS